MKRPCDDALDNLAAYLDGDLEAAERAVMQAHLAVCPACQAEARGQSGVKARLREYRRETSDVALPPGVWGHVRDAGRRYDARRRHRLQLRFGLAGACLLLFAFRAVWARFTVGGDFPVQAALGDFRHLRLNALKPQMATSDPDAAARWLREQIGGDVAPLDLSLSQARLTGADVIDLPNLRVGRLVYRGPQGAFAIYIAPQGARFPDAHATTIEGHTFANVAAPDKIGLLGWRHGSVGYGLAMGRQAGAAANTASRAALEALHATDAPTR